MEFLNVYRSRETVTKNLWLIVINIQFCLIQNISTLSPSLFRKRSFKHNFMYKHLGYISKIQRLKVHKYHTIILPKMINYFFFGGATSGHAQGMPGGTQGTTSSEEDQMRIDSLQGKHLSLLYLLSGLQQIYFNIIKWLVIQLYCIVLYSFKILYMLYLLSDSLKAHKFCWLIELFFWWGVC